MLACLAYKKYITNPYKSIGRVFFMESFVEILFPVLIYVTSKTVGYVDKQAWHLNIMF